jgi:hypothetical protein
VDEPAERGVQDWRIEALGRQYEAGEGDFVHDALLPIRSAGRREWHAREAI